MGEVIFFRNELLDALKEVFSNGAHFGSARLNEPMEVGMIDGHYIRITDGDGTFQSAEIKISRIASSRSRYHVSGLALWGKQRHFGPNIGEFDYIMELADDAFRQIDGDVKANPHSIIIKVHGEKLLVEEQNWLGIYGMNVNFVGEYQKSG